MEYYDVNTSIITIPSSHHLGKLMDKHMEEFMDNVNYDGEVYVMDLETLKDMVEFLTPQTEDDMKNTLRMENDILQNNKESYTTQ